MTRTFRFAFPIIFAVVIFAAAPLLSGGEKETLRYRRWLAPLEQIENWPFPPGLNVPINRQLFEHYIEQSATKIQLSESSPAVFSKTVLRAEFDGKSSVAGTGTFELPPQWTNPESIPLEPLNVPVIGAKWNDGTPASFICVPEGTLRLVVPNQSVKRLDFRWSLQKNTTAESLPVFDIAVPLSLRSELQFDMPDAVIPASSSGIIIPETENSSPHKSCRILLGQETKTTVTFQSPAEKSVTEKVPYRQTVSYRLTEQGLDVTVRFLFEKTNVRLNELSAEIETPLRLTDVRCGENSIVWHNIARQQQPILPSQTSAQSAVQTIRIDLSAIGTQQLRELTILAIAPVRENTDWKLPGIRIQSGNVFWLETRCGVNVFAPLKTSDIFVTNGVQVAPRTVVDGILRELFTFQYFKPDASVTLNACYRKEQMECQSATQIFWRTDVIRANTVLECQQEQDTRFALEFPLGENWTVDSVKSSDGNETDNIASWRTWNDPQKNSPQKLQIQLKRPLEAKKTLMLQLTGRYLKNTQQKFQLEALLPVKLPLLKSSPHFIGVQFEDMPFRLRSAAEGADTANTMPHHLKQGLTGSIFVLDAQTQTSELALVRAEPDYTAEIAENILLAENGLSVTFLFRCQPANSSADRIYVHFSAKNSAGENWTWTSNQSNLLPLRAKKLSEKELPELLPVFKTKVRLEDLLQGETWEIRLPSLQTEPFDLQAATTLPLEESLTIPLAALPAAVSQKAVMTVSSPHRFDYRIVNSRLHSVPSAAESWNRYSEIQAAFRYNPAEELRRPGQAPLSLQKLQPNETVNSAWIWSLRLNSRYEPEGNVKHNALMCVENRGRENVTITLPHGINVTDISSVLCSGTPADWRAAEGTNGLEESGNKKTNDTKSDKAALRRSLIIPLPEGRRFVTITVEYSHRDVPLVQQRKVRPRYLTADIPVLSGTWTAWFPPDYDVHLSRTSASSPAPAPSPSYGLSRCLAYWGSSKGFNPGSVEDWRRFFSQQQRHDEAAAIADKFFAEMDESLKKNQITSWGNFLSNDQIPASVIFRSDESVNVKLLVDKQAFRFIGITPAAPINALIAVPGRSFSEELFDRSGLVLLVSSRLRADKVKEYTLGITSPLRLPLYRQIQSERAGHCVRSAASQVFDQPDDKEDNGQSGANLSGVPLWDTPARWVSETVLSTSPWLAAPPFTSSLSADWQAVELQAEEEQLLRIVRRETMTALQWLAFLTTVLITSRKTLSSPILILFLLFVTEIIARSVAECYVMIPSGVFLGLCVSLGFTLIRSRHGIKAGMPLPVHTIKPYESTELDEKFVPTVMLNRRTLTTGIIIFVTVLTCRSAAEETLKLPGFTAPPQVLLQQALQQKEAYRVFYPTDSDKNTVGNEVWLPYEFLKILSQQQKPGTDDVQKHWSIVSAEYQGSLIRNPATEHLEADGGFTAEFAVMLDGGNAEITLGKLPVRTATWDGKPIAAIQRFDNNKEAVSVFIIENEVPGKHLLNVRIQETAVKSLPQGNGITFPVPKIPDSTLRLNVPEDVTDIRLADNYGAVTRTIYDKNVFEKSIVAADIGPADKISILWDSDTETAAVQRTSVEEYLWLFAKAEQTELKALFRFHFADTQTGQVSIKTDPRWLRSGQFQCDSVSVTSQDTGDVTQITFRSPPDGTVTIRADFVLKDFSGIGNVLMPQFQVLQAKTAKKMLAVSAENNLELVVPPLGQSSSFLSNWYGEGLLDIILDTRSWNTSPAAQYDVTQTLQDWVLGIQAKKILPDVKIKEDVLFDVKNSVFITAGEFETTADVFQLPFIFDRAAAIDRIEVRDSQNILLESRYSTGDTAAGDSTKSGAADKTGRGKIFFRKAAKGKFSVTVTGAFDAGSQKLEPIPSLVFTDCNIKGQTLNLFRRTSALAEIHSGQSAWQKSNIAPFLPDAFVSRSAAPPDTITAPILPLGQYDSGTSDGRSVSALPLMPQALVKANLPKLQGETRLSLYQENGGWAVEYAVTGEITGGELNTFRLIWDEHCRDVQSAQCASLPCDWSLEQTGGHSVLVLSPKTPLTGKVQILVKAALLQGADEVSVPVIFPDTASAALQMFVQLPQKAGEETIPWELQYLEACNLDNRVKDNGDENTQLLYRITDKEYQAKINRTNHSPVITLLDTGFLLRPDGTLFGLAAADVKVRGQDSCNVQLPADCEVIQMTRNGVIFWGTQLGNNRWQIDFWGSDYPQRLSILFRRNNSNNNKNTGSKERKIQETQAADNLLRFPLPVFEGIKVQETIWTLIKESGTPLEYDVQTLKKVRTQSNWDDNTVTDLGRHKFLTGNDVVQTQITVNLIRQHHLLRLLNSLPASAPGRTEEVKRWYSHWLAEWNSVTEKINYQAALTAALTANEPNKKPALLLDLQHQESEQAASTAVFLETMTSKTRDALQLAKQQSVKEKIDNMPGEGQKDTAGAAPMLNSLSYWQGRHGGETVYLFGICGGAAEEIRLTAVRWETVFPSAVSSVFWVVLCLAVLILILLYWNRIFVTELFIQFPHFWGTAAGLLLWSATPLSGAGMIIVILTLLSLFRPSWQRRKMPE